MFKKDFNVFICYRGIGDGNRENVIDGKPIALDVCYELSKEPRFKCFFAPKEYQLVGTDDFYNDIPDIVKSVKVAVIIITEGFFEGCKQENDVVYKEIKELIGVNAIFVPVIVSDVSLESKRTLIKELFGDNFVDNFITRVRMSYDGIYKFAFMAESLRNSINQIFDALENNVDFEHVKNQSILVHLNSIASVSSATYAIEKIINLLIGAFKEAEQALDDIRRDTPELVEKLCQKVPHFSTIRVDNLPKIMECLSESTSKKAREALEDYKQNVIEGIQRDIRRTDNVVLENDKILTFSESKHVINMLNNLEAPIRKSCQIYICEARAKVSEPFEDAKKIYDTLSEFENKCIISDNSIYSLMKEKKITKVLLGACAVKTENNILVSFINTAGTEIIVEFARQFNIPVYIISEFNKHLDNFSNRENKGSVLDDTNYVYDSIDYIKLNRTENIIFVSEKGVDVLNILNFYHDDIWKDRRMLCCTDVFMKSCSKEEFFVEKIVLESLLKKEDVKVARILSTNEREYFFELEKIKGIRIFELFVALDLLSRDSNVYARDLKEELIKKCNENQRVINSHLHDLLKDEKLEIYPRTKVVEFIALLYDVLLISHHEELQKINFKSLVRDAEYLYERFCYFVKRNPRPFRDSTIKNMALCDEVVSNIQCDFTNYKEVVKFATVLSSKLNQETVFSISKSDICDFDFSSCINLTSQYDDYIGLNMHERTYSSYVENWVLENHVGNEEFVVSLIVRYLRFGGRKLVYRQLNPSLHKVRFKFDNEQFYFEKMKFYIDMLFPEYKQKTPTLYLFLTTIASLNLKKPQFDLFSYVYNEKKRQAWLGMCANNVDSLSNK